MKTMIGNALKEYLKVADFEAEKDIEKEILWVMKQKIGEGKKVLPYNYSLYSEEVEE